MSASRSSGILLHPTSLPGDYGIGDLGPQAYKFVDFLISCNQGYWQVLPLGPVGFGNSPYQCFSAFAGNILMISPQKLIEAGFLSETDLNDAPSDARDRVDFGAVIDFKNRILHKAFDNFKANSRPDQAEAFRNFCQLAASWLDEYTLFAALKEANQGAAWSSWDEKLARRDRKALATAREQLRDSIEAKKFFQYLFYQQWLELKRYCNERKIKIIGDLPIFVAYDSADMWQQPNLFKVDDKCNLTAVAGVPPDAFSKTGQLWGNPLYNWDKMRSTHFKWWVDRLRAMMQIFDIVRLDHFRGFAACWEVPAGEETAINGQWVKVPGRELFNALKKNLGKLPVIAEDLGVITPDVVELRDEFGFPGMRVLQFAFGSGSDNIHLPHHYISNQIAYTGTHDNDTTVGWFNNLVDVKAEATPAPDDAAAENQSNNGEHNPSSEAAPEAAHEAATVPNPARVHCFKYLNTDGHEINWALIRAAFASVAETAIMPLQDLLGLDSNARMNFPASSDGNWGWRFREEHLTPELAARLKDLTVLYGRGPVE